MSNIKPNQSEIQDEHLLQLARSQGRCGAFTARRYANILRRRATAAIEERDFQAALELAEREFEFCGRAFGISHPHTRAAGGFLFAVRICVQLAAC